MNQKVPYTLHREREEEFRLLVKCLDKQRHPDATNLKAEALNKLRIDQRLDAIAGVAGRTVHVYRAGVFIDKVSRCRVGDATAIICFVLEERDDNDAIINRIEVTADMDIFVENMLV